MIKFYATAAIAALALASCNKEIELAVTPANGEGIQVSIVADNALDGTKTALSGASSVVWTATDKVGFVNVAAKEKAESGVADIDGDGKATFTATVENTGSYFAYYPYSTDWALSDEGNVQHRIKTAQTPASATTFDPKADVLVSEAFDVTATGAKETPSTIRFKRLGAFLKIRFVDNTTGTKLSDQYATTVSIQSAGTGAQRLATKLVFNETGIVDEVPAEYTITATYESGVYAISNASQAAYLGVRPVTLPSGSNLIITANTAKYSISKTVTLSSDVTIGSGDILPIRVTINDADLPMSVTKLWDKISGDTGNGISGSWMASLTDGVVTGTAQGDRNVAIDGENVYVAEFNNSKNIWAISIADPSSVKRLPTTSVKSEGLSNNYLSCVRSVRNSNPSYNGGKDVLIATNLMSGGNNTLYIYDNGIDAEPRVVEMLNCDGRLGDTFTTYGDYGNCMLTFGKHEGNGFVHFALPTSGNSTSLQNRFQITVGGENTNTANFPAFYPIPGDITKGVYGQRGEARAMWAEASTDEATVFSAWEQAWATPAIKLHYGIGGDATNGNGYAVGYNFLELGGKRYVIYGRISSAGSCELIIREGAMSDAWTTILGLDGVAEPKPRIFYEKIVTKNDSFLSGNSGLDIAVYKKSETEAYIAIDKQNVGLTVYTMSIE